MQKVSVVKSDDYASVGSAVEKSIDLLGGIASFVNKGKTILLKPNLCNPLPPEKAATTHPSVIRAVIELVRQAGGVPVVGELAVGSTPNRTQEAFLATGVAKLCQETKTPLINFQTGKFVQEDIHGYKFLEKTDFIEAIFNVDGIINLPKLKTHGITYLTGAVKNFFGCVHPEEREYVHSSGNDALCQAVVDIYSFVKPKVILNIMDAVVAMEGDEGPTYGNTKKVGYILCSADAVAIDTVSARLLNHNPSAIPTTKYATQRSLGSSSPDKIEIVGDTLPKITDFQHHRNYVNRFQECEGLQPRISKACQKCGSCISSCPAKAISENYEIDEKKCLKCYCCLEVCIYGAVALEPSLQEKTNFRGHYIVKLNSKCNANCIFCADTPQVRNAEDFPWQKLISDLEENRKRFDSVLISGGEPTIYPKLPEYVKYAKEVCAYRHVNITTNALRLSYKDFVNQLSGVDSYTISFVTSDEKVYSAVTRVKDSFQLIKKAMSNIRSSGKEMRVNLVIHKLNYLNLANTISFLVSEGVNSIQLSFMNPIGSSVKQSKSVIAVRYTEVMPCVREAFKAAKESNFVKLYIENFPVCVAPEFSDRIADLRKPAENKEYYNACKVKPDKCVACAHFDTCDGVWDAYVKQFGEQELLPVASDTSSLFYNKRYYDLVKGFAPMDSFEWLGLKEDFKQVSIFYVNKSDLNELKKRVAEKGFFCEVSDFVLNQANGFTDRTFTDIHEGSLFSVYVAKEKDFCKHFKLIDQKHQFNFGQDSAKFYEIGKLLGYPKCCSDFILGVHTSPEFKGLMQDYGKLFDDETLYPMAAMTTGKPFHPLLNNLNQYAKLVNFYVCSYSCENALRVASRVFEGLTDKAAVMRELMRPFVFFSPHKIIYLQDAVLQDGKVSYSDCFHAVPDKPASHPFLTGVFSRFARGNSFTISDRKILIYNDDRLLFEIKKSHPYDGVYVQPELK